jgi:nucleoid-associated protein YgaU
MELILLLAAALILIFVAGTWARNLMVSDTPIMNVEITVQRGDTLWSVAQAYGDPDEYILERVDKLAKANSLERGAVLNVGQTLVVPMTGRMRDLVLRRHICKQTDCRLRPL